MIRADHLTKRYNGTEVVSAVSFEVEQDQTLVLLGTSGSGKTTTLKMINRLIPPDEGTVYIDGSNTAFESPENLRRKIGFVLQNIGLFPHYTVEQNIAAVPHLLGWEDKRIGHRVNELMEKLNLPYSQFGKAYPKDLSGGQQQRVGLARALAANPKILLMDEPFSALDPITRKNIRKEFRELDELKNKTIVMVTHDVQEAFEMGNQIFLMSGGKIIQTGSPQDILFHSQTEFAGNFLSDQQFVLELKAVLLAHIWNIIEEVDAPHKNFPIYSADQSLFEVLESSIKQSEMGHLMIQDENGNSKITSFPQLLKGFSIYKKTYS